MGVYSKGVQPLTRLFYDSVANRLLLEVKGARAVGKGLQRRLLVRLTVSETSLQATARGFVPHMRQQPWPVLLRLTHQILIHLLAS